MEMLPIVRQRLKDRGAEAPPAAHGMPKGSVGRNTALLKVVTVLFAILCGALLSHLIDDDLGLGWPHNVVRNWDEFGLLKLNGQLVTNPGGFDVVRHPEIYQGMSPVSLYPAYFATMLFAWTGLGTLSYHVLLSALVIWGIWELLGRTDFALLAATVTILLPGYLRWQKI